MMSLISSHKMKIKDFHKLKCTLKQLVCYFLNLSVFKYTVTFVVKK